MRTAPRPLLPTLARAACWLLAATLVLTAGGCQDRASPVEAGLVRVTLQTAGLLGLTETAAQNAIISQGTGLPLGNALSNEPFSDSRLSRMPTAFDFPGSGTLSVDFAAATAGLNADGPTVSGTASISFASVDPGQATFVVGANSGNRTYRVTVTLTAPLIGVWPADGSSAMIPNRTSYSFYLRLNWSATPDPGAGRSRSARFSNWTLSAAIEMHNATVSANGRTPNGPWAIDANGDRLSVVIINAGLGQLQMSRALVANWSMQMTANGVSHALVWHRPQINELTLTIDGIAHGPFDQAQFLAWCDQASGG